MKYPATMLCAPHNSQGKVIYGTDNPRYCYKILPIENFHWLNKSKGLRHHTCSSCRCKYDMKRYENPEARQLRAASVAKASKKRRAQLKSIVDEIKSNSPCVDCGGSFHPVAMDFDHVRGTKKYGIAEMVGDRKSWDKIQKEIDKCELRCANCHRIKTYEEQWKHAPINNPVIT